MCGFNSPSSVTLMANSIKSKQPMEKNHWPFRSKAGCGTVNKFDQAGIRSPQLGGLSKRNMTNDHKLLLRNWIYCQKYLGPAKSSQQLITIINNSKFNYDWKNNWSFLFWLGLDLKQRDYEFLSAGFLIHAQTLALPIAMWISSPMRPTKKCYETNSLWQCIFWLHSAPSRVCH